MLTGAVRNEWILGQHVSKHDLTLLAIVKQIGDELTFKVAEIIQIENALVRTWVDTCSGINELAPAKEMNPSTCKQQLLYI